MNIHKVHSHIRSMAKSISWRVVGSLDTFAISWWMTGHAALGFGIAGTEVLTKVVWYYLHERLWRHIHTRWTE